MKKLNLIWKVRIFFFLKDEIAVKNQFCYYINIVEI